MGSSEKGKVRLSRKAALEDAKEGSEEDATASGEPAEAEAEEEKTAE